MYNSNVQQCVKSCAAGYTFDDPTALKPNCIACDAGKFTDSHGNCKVCSQLGFTGNAIAVSGSGCIECGARAQATTITSTTSCIGCFTQCTPCPAQYYLPVGSAICRPCEDGFVLKTSSSSECTPCAAGLKLLVLSF